jgi:regulator of replication initiation timing
MSDPITLTLASTAVGLVNGTIGLLKEARDAAKRSDDHDLKDKLSEVFDAVLELKEVIGNLREENAGLRMRLETRDNLKWDTKRKLYFADGDPDPFCPACMDLNARQVRLHPVADSVGHPWRYDCKICKNLFVVNR